MIAPKERVHKYIEIKLIRPLWRQKVIDLGKLQLFLSSYPAIIHH